MSWGGMPPMFEGDTPPGKRPLGEAGTGKRGSVEGDGTGKLRPLSWEEGVPGSPMYMFPSPPPPGVRLGPGYFGGAESPNCELGVCGPGEDGRAGSAG